MKVEFMKLREDATIPTKGSEGAAGYDLVATEIFYNSETGKVTIGTGIAVKIPEGYVGYLFARGNIHNRNLILSNSVGVIDSDYTGEIKAFMTVSSYSSSIKHSNISGYDMGVSEVVKHYGNPRLYSVGDRCVQLIIMPVPDIEFVEVDKLPETERGDGCLGSTGF